MIGWFSGIRARLVWIVGAVVLAHAVVFAALLSFRVPPIQTVELDSVEISFAEIEPEPVEADPLEIIPASQSAPVNERSAPAEGIKPDRSSVATVAQDQIAPPVLMQDAPAAREALSAEAESDPAPSDAPRTLDEAELATIVQTLNCQRLSRDRDAACPKLDPFNVAVASQARREAAPAPPHLVGNFGPKSYLEGFLSQEDRDPFLMPGMSADLFTPAMPKGAYNAQRIREGKTPLWDKDIEAGFTRED